MNSNIKRIRVLIFSFLILFTFNSINAGVLKGKVYDKNSEKPLPAANIYLKGTNFGAASDLDGNFYIQSVPEGEYEVVVSYIGYETRTIKVKVPTTGSVTQDFGLSPITVRGKEVVVTAQALGQVQAISQQLASDKIANVVSEARLQELPDFNAAQALSRLPGVSTLESSGEANKVVIRGIAPQYNSVSVEGVRLTSTGSTQMGVTAIGGGSGHVNTDRSVDLSMISPYMIKSISVYKSITPDMNANTVGGTVEMQLREAPSGFRYDILGQSGYTYMTNNYGNYRFVVSVSNRIFNERLGFYLLGNMEKYDRDADIMNAGYITTSVEIDTLTGYRPVRVTNVTLNRHVETRERYGANLILDYRLPYGYIKMLNLYARRNSDFEDYRTVLNYNDRLIGFNMREGSNNIDILLNSLEFNNDFNGVIFNLKLANTMSKNNLPESPYVSFRSGVAYKGVGKVPENTKPESLKVNWIYPGPDSIYLNTIQLWSTLYKESKKSVKSFLKVPYKIGSFISGYVKFGGEYFFKEIINDQEAPYAGMQYSGNYQQRMLDTVAARFNLFVDPQVARYPGTNFMGDAELMEPFLNDRFGRMHWVPDSDLLLKIAEYLNSDPRWAGKATGGPDETGGWYNGLFQQSANDYIFSEEYYAGYLMTEINLWKIKFIGGARYEKTINNYTVYNMFDMRNPENQAVDTVETRNPNEYLLPAVSIKISPFDWMDIRYAYTKSLARPAYHQMSPKISFNNPRNYVWAGNPDLKPGQSFNHDFAIAFHGNRLGLLTIGAFYKKIKDFIYHTNYRLYDVKKYETIKTIDDFQIVIVNKDGTVSVYKPERKATVSTYINGIWPAYVKGIEFDFQTRLWFMPGLMKGVVFGINYAKIKSETKYPLREDKTVIVGPRQTETFVVDSTRTGRLIYQPDDILNAYVGYDHKGFSIRLSFNYQGDMASYVGSYPEQDGYTRDYFKIDLSVRQKLPVWKSEIYLDVTNLNNEINESAQITIDGFTNMKYYGMVANAGIRFRF